MTITNLGKSKKAFTLRLDQDRHLRLRLAAVVEKCSEQELVMTAINSCLLDAPEIHLPKGAAKAAFTLRLDQKHRQILSYEAIKRECSGQALVVGALDIYLADMPIVERLARQIRPS